MEIFRTLVRPSSLSHKINYDSKILMLGSCFSQNIGAFFKESKFQIDLNPFGIQYNPHSVANALERIISGKLYQENELFFHQEQWHSFDHHGSFSNADKDACLHDMNTRIKKSHENINKLTHLIITLGTNYYFQTIKEPKVVNNCHKIDNREFDRIEMSSEDIRKLLLPLFRKLKTSNPQLQIILTVSPIRYIQRGFIENSFSKAKLLNAIDLLQKEDPSIVYYPVYEIVLDDLRDYRFYKEDMIHPSSEAIRYLWGQVKTSMIEPSCFQTMDDIQAIKRDMHHRPNNAMSQTYQTFLRSIDIKINKVAEQFGQLDFNEEKALLAEKKR